MNIAFCKNIIFKSVLLCTAILTCCITGHDKTNISYKFSYKEIVDRIEDEIDSTYQILKNYDNPEAEFIRKSIENALKQQLLINHANQATLFDSINKYYSELLYIEGIEFFYMENGYLKVNYESFLYLKEEYKKLMYLFPGDYDYTISLRNPKKSQDRKLYKRLKRSVKDMFSKDFYFKREINPSYLNYFQGKDISFIIITKVDKSENFCRLIFQPHGDEIYTKLNPKDDNKYRERKIQLIMRIKG